MFGITIRTSVLHYRKRSNGKYADLRQIEARLPRRRFARISLNGQYRSGKRQYQMTRYANPGWSIGFEQLLVNWSHHRRHCWHLSFEVARRGITLSYGRAI